MSTLYLSLGSNIGPRRETLEAALRLIGERVGQVESRSRFIETEPWGFESPHPFLNAACRVRTLLTPPQVLSETLRIERELGRTRKTVGGNYHDRPIDIDLLFYDDLHIDRDFLVDGTTHRLTLPHPLIGERPFVLEPLAEVWLTPTPSDP